MAKVLIFGLPATGKTELLRQLADQSVTRKNTPYQSSLGYDFQHIDGLQVWDSPATNNRFNFGTQVWGSGVGLGIYCINLSQEINESVLEEIKKDIQSFQKMNAQAKLLLVGTFSDCALSENTQESLRENLKEFDCIDVVTISTSESNGSKPVLTAIQQWNEARNKITAIRNKFPVDSVLYGALDHLSTQALQLGLDENAMHVLGAEVDTLLNKITNPQLLDKTKAYNEFIAGCDAKFAGKYNGFNAAIRAFAAIVLVTALAATLFFSAGIALGAWAGVSTFLTAVAEGTTGATLFTVGTCATAGFATPYFLGRFFHKPVTQLANEFVDSIKNEDLNMVGY